MRRTNIGIIIIVIIIIIAIVVVEGDVAEQKEFMIGFEGCGVILRTPKSALTPIPIDVAAAVRVNC